ncbi:GNAT family N-acetyltransferase [Amycolatopsis sp. H20-H5]|uniref:GNAT family N-acetyltransferase n=1 Tax=Amycolatopsis sp. H20-H5 TaxID=3046309 RepID=UPI002DB7728D|nr:GNAT family N-acetyltransferase [Amycolatopsis sp. H20-H5]MEC3975434.1 GNAT family N-acetyltransferase [Amycolatopsis sp. H20-H5]
MSVEVRAVPERTRYEISVDGEVAGFKVDDRFAGQGLAGKLVAAALDDVRKQGKSLLPYCPYVRAFVGKHPEYADLVPAAKLAEFDL